MTEKTQAKMALVMSTFAFAVCFATWLMYGVLITFLIDAQLFEFSQSQVGWLIGLPILTGSVMRLPMGVLTDRYGGRAVMTLLMLASAVPLFLTSLATSYIHFLLAGLGFGLAGASFAVGIGYVASWFKRERVGTALGVFGAGNAGAALTSVVGPLLLRWLTDGGRQPEGWRNFPKIYAAALAVTALLFFALTRSRVVGSKGQSLVQRLAPLKSVRVWRFGLYYFLVFGGFVALAQWMIPYCVNVYEMSIATAGVLAAVFSFPSGVIRAFGGWLSDRFGARRVMVFVFSVTALACAILIVPRMQIRSPGPGVMSRTAGEVTHVSAREIRVDDVSYSLVEPDGAAAEDASRNGQIWPQVTQWQEPVVSTGDRVSKKQLLARGVTNIFYPANVWIFTALVFVIGLMTGIGKAAVYKYIPDYFPDSVGVTGGMVGVIGGLGGVVCPIIFGYLLGLTGLWSSCWFFLALLSLVCLVWMQIVVRRTRGKWKDQMQRALRPSGGGTST